MRNTEPVETAVLYALGTLMFAAGVLVGSNTIAHFGLLAGGMGIGIALEVFGGGGDE